MKFYSQWLIIISTILFISGCATPNFYSSPDAGPTAKLSFTPLYTVKDMFGLPIGGRQMALGVLNPDGCVDNRQMGQVPDGTTSIIVPAEVEVGFAFNDATLHIGGCGLNFYTTFESGGDYILDLQKYENYCKIILGEKNKGNVEITKMKAHSFSKCKYD